VCKLEVGEESNALSTFSSDDWKTAITVLFAGFEIEATAIKHPAPDQVKQSFLIFDIRAL